MKFYVYGYYPTDEEDDAECVGQFETEEEALEFIKEFTSIPGQVAWIEE